MVVSAVSDSPVPADFGANEWLVEELYQRYQADPSSVDRAWWSFFADYQPALGNGRAPAPAEAPPVVAQAAPAPAAVATASPDTVPSPAAPPVAAPPPAADGAEVERLRG